MKLQGELNQAGSAKFSGESSKAETYIYIYIHTLHTHTYIYIGRAAAK